MKKIDVNKSLIFNRNVEDLKNSLDYLYKDGYCSNSEDFSEYQQGNLDGVHASTFMFRPFELTQNGDNEFFSYFIPKSKAVFIEEEPKKKTWRQFKSREEFFNVTGFKVGDIVQIKKLGNLNHEETAILTGIRLYIDGEYQRIEIYFGSIACSFSVLFENYRYFKNGEWLRFGVEE